MSVRILVGDALAQLRTLPDESVQCCVSSPPYYGLRDYGTATWEGGDPACDHQGSIEHTAPPGTAKQRSNAGSNAVRSRSCRHCGATRKDDGIGLEATPEAHIAALVEVFREVRRVLRKDGVLWLNYGDAYAGSWGAQGRSETPATISRNQIANHPKKASHTGTIRSDGIKPKDLLMLPSRVALALQADGWWLRSMLPWVKRRAMPESVTDRPATAIEYVFLLTRSARYFWDGEAVRQAYQPDSVARVERGRSGSHKWADGGPGDQTLARDISKACTSPTGRNFRNSDLFYASLEAPHGLISGPDGEPLALDVNPAGYSDAHFATFPPKLIEPLIKAATSERGCCPACGAPWVREIERGELTPDAPGYRPRGRTSPDNRVNVGMTLPGSAQPAPNHSYEIKTLGWSPSCGCGGDPVPCTLLDPFGGAGTTGLVADRLGRNAILIELNPEYAEMARQRIHRDAPLFSDVRHQESGINPKTEAPSDA